jgi:Asp-tRNA(Asn)/Glu-tRNA(Gln) amidotransferase A subunit family amidase
VRFAVAVANGLADIAFGTDTAGSVHPALAVSIPLSDKILAATSLQLVGPRLSEAGLLNAGRLVETRSRL